MIIPSRRSALIGSLVQRFEKPQQFGVSLTSNGLALDEALESLVAVNEWNWLTRDMLVDVVFRADSIELKEQYLTYIDNQVRQERSLTVPSVPYSGRVFFPDAREPSASLSEQGFIELFSEQLWTQILRDRRDGPSSRIRRFYSTFEKAATVGWALSGDLKSIDIRWASTGTLGPSMSLGALNDDVLLAKGIDLHSLKAVALTSEQQAIRNIQTDIWLKETLYVEESGIQSTAAANLYEALPQSKVESLLLPFLQDPDPDVRTNVLIALGMPSYKMGFAPGKPLLSRSERLEPVSIQPTSLRTVLTVLKQETNQRVMDNLVCLLSSQTFEGKLRPHAGEVYVVVRELMSKLKSRQSVKDCAEIMAGLPFDGDRG